MDVVAIHEIAKEARSRFERKAIPIGELERAFSESYFDAGRGFVERLCRNFPDENCTLASAYLRTVIPVETVIVHATYAGAAHTWLECKNLGIAVIDITADQFGGQKVYVGERKNPWEEPVRTLWRPQIGQRFDLPTTPK